MKLWIKSLYVTIQVQAGEQYLPLVIIIQQFVLQAVQQNEILLLYRLFK